MSEYSRFGDSYTSAGRYGGHVSGLGTSPGQSTIFDQPSRISNLSSVSHSQTIGGTSSRPLTSDDVLRRGYAGESVLVKEINDRKSAIRDLRFSPVRQAPGSAGRYFNHADYRMGGGTSPVTRLSPTASENQSILNEVRSARSVGSTVGSHGREIGRSGGLSSPGEVLEYVRNARTDTERTRRRLEDAGIYSTLGSRSLNREGQGSDYALGSINTGPASRSYGAGGERAGDGAARMSSPYRTSDVFGSDSFGDQRKLALLDRELVRERQEQEYTGRGGIASSPLRSRGLDDMPTGPGESGPRPYRSPYRAKVGVAWDREIEGRLASAQASPSRYHSSRPGSRSYAGASSGRGGRDASPLGLYNRERSPVRDTSVHPFVPDPDNTPSRTLDFMSDRLLSGKRHLARNRSSEFENDFLSMYPSSARRGVAPRRNDDVKNMQPIEPMSRYLAHNAALNPDRPPSKAKQKMLVRWLNSLRAGRPVTDLRHDIQSGTLLCRALEILEGHGLRIQDQPAEAGAMADACIDNIQKGMRVIQQRNPRRAHILPSPEEVYSGYLDRIYVLLQEMFMVYVSLPIRENARQLLSWYRSILDNYSRDIRSTPESLNAFLWDDFSSATSLICVLHYFHPRGVVQTGDVVWSPMSKIERQHNVRYVFRLLKELQIRACFDADEFMECADTDFLLYQLHIVYAQYRNIPVNSTDYTGVKFFDEDLSKPNLSRNHRQASDLERAKQRQDEVRDQLSRLEDKVMSANKLNISTITELEDLVTRGAAGGLTESDMKMKLLLIKEHIDREKRILSSAEQEVQRSMDLAAKHQQAAGDDGLYSAVFPSHEVDPDMQHPSPAGPGGGAQRVWSRVEEGRMGQNYATPPQQPQQTQRPDNPSASYSDSTMNALQREASPEVYVPQLNAMASPGQQQRSPPQPEPAQVQVSAAPVQNSHSMPEEPAQAVQSQPPQKPVPKEPKPAVPGIIAMELLRAVMHTSGDWFVDCSVLGRSVMTTTTSAMTSEPSWEQAVHHQVEDVETSELRLDFFDSVPKQDPRGFVEIKTRGMKLGHRQKLELPVTGQNGRIIGNVMVNIEVMDPTAKPAPKYVTGSQKIKVLLMAGEMREKKEWYCVLEFKNKEVRKTKVSKRTNQPAFNELVSILVDDVESAVLSLEMWDDEKGLIKDKKLGTGTQALAKLVEGVPNNFTAQIFDDKGRSIGSIGLLIDVLPSNAKVDYPKSGKGVTISNQSSQNPMMHHDSSLITSSSQPSGYFSMHNMDIPKQDDHKDDERSGTASGENPEPSASAGGYKCELKMIDATMDIAKEWYVRVMNGGAQSYETMPSGKKTKVNWDEKVQMQVVSLDDDVKFNFFDNGMVEDKVLGTAKVDYASLELNKDEDRWLDVNTKSGGQIGTIHISLTLSEAEGAKKAARKGNTTSIDTSREDAERKAAEERESVARKAAENRKAAEREREKAEQEKRDAEKREAEERERLKTEKIEEERKEMERLKQIEKEEEEARRKEEERRAEAKKAQEEEEKKRKEQIEKEAAQARARKEAVKAARKGQRPQLNFTVDEAKIPQEKQYSYAVKINGQRIAQSRVTPKKTKNPKWGDQFTEALDHSNEQQIFSVTVLTPQKDKNIVVGTATVTLPNLYSTGDIAPIDNWFTILDPKKRKLGSLHVNIFVIPGRKPDPTAGI